MLLFTRLSLYRIITKIERSFTMFEVVNLLAQVIVTITSNVYTALKLKYHKKSNLSLRLGVCA